MFAETERERGERERERVTVRECMLLYIYIYNMFPVRINRCAYRNRTDTASCCTCDESIGTVVFCQGWSCVSMILFKRVRILQQDRWVGGLVTGKFRCKGLTVWPHQRAGEIVRSWREDLCWREDLWEEPGFLWRNARSILMPQIFTLAACFALHLLIIHTLLLPKVPQKATPMRKTCPIPFPGKPFRAPYPPPVAGEESPPAVCGTPLGTEKKALSCGKQSIETSKPQESDIPKQPSQNDHLYHQIRDILSCEGTTWNWYTSITMNGPQQTLRVSVSKLNHAVIAMVQLVMTFGRVMNYNWSCWYQQWIIVHSWFRIVPVLIGGVE